MKVGTVDADLPVPLQRLRTAMNDHDLDAVTSCFASGYRNETPLHPTQNFVGAAQVRQNWSRILGSVPDLTATLIRWAEDGSGAPRAGGGWGGHRPGRPPPPP